MDSSGDRAEGLDDSQQQEERVVETSLPTGACRNSSNPTLHDLWKTPRSKIRGNVGVKRESISLNGTSKLARHRRHCNTSTTTMTSTKK